MLQVLLLLIAIVGVFVLPSKFPNWSMPVIAAAVLIATGGIKYQGVLDALHPLLAPVAFLLLAVPLAIMLDRLGFFASLAALVESGRNPALGLWILAAAVTTFLNLDASVVLLTPLYIHIARRHGMNAKMLAFQPVLLACLASSALPISNLTNLIAAEQMNLGVSDFLFHLGLPSLAAVIVGWLSYRYLGYQHLRSDPVRDPVDHRALRLGGPIALFVVIGFTAGGLIGVPPWAIALVADVVLIALTRKLTKNDFPFGAAVLAASLGVVAVAAAPHLGIHQLFGNAVSPNSLDQLRTAGIAIVGANTVNNLPALLVGLTAIDPHSPQIWPLLFGVNFGPILILHGSLAGLLWRSTAARLGVHVSAWEYSKMGLKVGIPSVCAGLAILLVFTP